MELRLTFKKKEIADLYQESYQTWDSESRTLSKSKKLTIIILISFTLLTFGLTYIHFDWIYYGVIFFVTTIIYDFRTRRQKRTTEKEVKKWWDEVDSFLRKYENIDNIKYTYDSDKIQYFEQGKLIVEILWDNIISMDTNDKWIYVYLKDPKQNIWIPRVTTDKEELKLFEQTIASRLQNGR